MAKETAQPPGPVKLNQGSGLNVGLQKKGTSISGKVPGKMITFKPGVNYGKKRDGGKY